MAKLVKENKVVVVEDELVEQFLDQGFDQIDPESGEVIKHATGGRQVTLAQLNAVKVELAAAKQTIADQKGEIKVLEDENDRLDKLVKSLKQNQNQKR